ncbi:MAG: hypothetical protein K8L97_28770 [Anaerolineae bacterium]|nr:hypothetical protein [Anaerolineae bacterium]
MLFLLLASGRLNPLSAQTTPVYEVFLQRDVDEIGTDRLTFIDLLTGEESPVEVIGERYTPFGDAVMYYEPATNRVMLAEPNGTTQPHPFIQPSASTRRVDWLFSPTRIAWTLVEGETESLTTTTTVANLDGTNPRPILVDGPRSSIRALPVAFSTDETRLFMDFQPEGISDFTPYPQYAGLFAVDIATGEWDYLPDEPGCFCGAGFGGGLFLRLNVSRDLSGFDLRVFNLLGEVDTTIPAQPIRDFTQAGNIVVSPDGAKAVYALAQITDFGRQSQSARTVFMLVDLALMTQTPLTEPITTFVEPLAWTEDNTAVIFTSRQRDGTWKVSLTDGTLDKIAEATYLGVVQ